MLCGRDRMLRTLCLAAGGWQDNTDKGNLQQDPGECTMVSLISVLDKAGKS